VGALYVRKGVKLAPVYRGGGQEGGLRSGTLNAPGIAGFGAAAALCTQEECLRMAGLRDYFINAVLQCVPGSSLNGDSKNRLCNNVNMSFVGAPSAGVLLRLSARGVYVSSGSACAAGKNRPSDVLLAMGLGPERAATALRLSLSRWTAKRELAHVLKELETAVREERDNVS
jgi:cysteine desulfurase